MRTVALSSLVALLLFARDEAQGQPSSQPSSNTGAADGSSPSQSAGVGLSATANAQVPLWRGLVWGMDANYVALHLQTLPEIKQAEARLKKGKPPEIKVKYNSPGLALFGFKMNVGFDFGSSGLRYVTLASQANCDDATLTNSFKELVAGLRERYPVGVNIVGKDGQNSASQLAFTDKKTLVVVMARSVAPPSGYTVAKANLDATLAEAEKSFNALGLRYAAIRLQSARDGALRSCPATDGNMASVTLIYSSYTDMNAQQKKSDANSEEQKRQDRDKL